MLYTDLAFLDGVCSTCGDCQGRRYTEQVLALTVDGASISGVLDMTAAQALDFFAGKDIRRRQAVVDVGLGYLTLGQPLSTLSGGECQRLKLAGELHKQGEVYVLDEPTTWLHMSDCGHLLGLLDRLVDGCGSVIVIEHNLRRGRARGLGDRPGARRRRRRWCGGVRGAAVGAGHGRRIGHRGAPGPLPRCSTGGPVRAPGPPRQGSCSPIRPGWQARVWRRTPRRHSSC